MIKGREEMALRQTKGDNGNNNGSNKTTIIIINLIIVS